jgi:hypothetical protein
VVAPFLFFGVAFVLFGFEIATGDLDREPTTLAATGLGRAESACFSISIFVFLATWCSFRLGAKSTEEPDVASGFCKPVA